MTTNALRELITSFSRQDRIGPLSKWCSDRLDADIASGRFISTYNVRILFDHISTQLETYSAATGVSTVVLGMSGGVDSALTAAVFKSAGWRVVGVTLPIDQNPEETDRGIEACRALGIEHENIDLSDLYHAAANQLAPDRDNKAERIRHGNIRARLRMIALYNRAHELGGIVGSTDNLSEHVMGFWTIAGDIGDVAPIQSLTKSWEVPYMAMLAGVPESTWKATPTDGLGIDANDEAQLGASYLQVDLLMNALMDGVRIEDIPAEDRPWVDKVMARMKATWFKRHGVVNLEHLDDRYGEFRKIDYRPSWT